MGGTIRNAGARRSVPLLAVTVLAAILPLVAAAPAAAQDYTLGIDVSHHQPEINWVRVAESGHVYAFHKATEGATFVDDEYAINRPQARDAGVPFGAYHFARPNGSTIAEAQTDARAEARHFFDTAQPAPGDMLPVLDLEATGGLGAKRLIAWVQAWLDTVKADVGVEPLIYTSPSFWETNLGDTTTFAEQGFPLWLAHYTSANSPRTPASNWGGQGWAFWQWTSCATIPGISGCVDENRYEGSDLSPYTIPGAPEPSPSEGEATPPSNQSPPEISGTNEVGQTLSASTGTWNGTTPLSYSFAWHRCDQDGTGCSAILNGTKPTYKLGPADYNHRMKVTVTATNSAGSSSADSATTERVTDTTAPVAPRVTKPQRAQTLMPRLNVAWARAEENATYDVRYRKSNARGSFGDHGSLVSGTPERSARLRPARGNTYCFSARATDTAGNISGWSNERCTVVPLDDRDLRAAGGWKRASAKAFYLKTSTKTTSRGASLVVNDVAVREILVVAQTCPNCGKVEVLFNDKRVGTIDLESSRALDKQVLQVARFTSLRRGNVSLVVLSRGAPVRIDGLVTAVR